MNCNDYKESIAADPSELLDGGAEHAASCESCGSYRNEMRALNDRISRALSIEVPELQMPDLTPIEDDTTVINLPFVRKSRLSAPIWMGLAASVAIAAVFGARFLNGGGEYLSLADEVIAHLDHEPSAFKERTVAVSSRVLNNVVSDDVADLGGVGLITYARTCPINGKQVPHLVIQGEKGPITVLLMPDEKIDAAMPLEGRGIKGVILPVGRGSIAIIGERDEQLEQFNQQVIDSVRWST